MVAFRHPDLLALAARAPRCMSCGAPADGTIVPAHANHIWKGMGLKAPDWAWAAMDYTCHKQLDQGASLDREDRRAMWLEAFYKTLDWLWTSGLIRVAADPVEHVNPPRRPSKKIAKGRPLQSGRKLQSRTDWPEGRRLQSHKFDRPRGAKS